MGVQKTNSALGLLAATVIFLAPGGGRAEISSFSDTTEPGQPIQVLVGEVFTVTLISNPTTGYSWQLAGAPDETIVEIISSEYRPDATTKRFGAGGKEFWRFKAVGKGETTISLKYSRPWEKDKPPVETKTFRIIVN